jgi:transcriptional regulator with XRE-family HTH domain
MTVDQWAQYVRQVAGNLNQLEIAAKTGIAQSNVGRWLRGEPGLPKAESVVALARAFDQPPIEALVAAGYITEEEAGAKARRGRTPLNDYTDRELVAELSRRVG